MDELAGVCMCTQPCKRIDRLGLPKFHVLNCGQSGALLSFHGSKFISKLNFTQEDEVRIGRQRHENVCLMLDYLVDPA